ncbi:hypothetical protein [Lacticaseibacillus kribbianus]|uniref:hypothetical protein n=1 Tax=Lacticaseibacillus kribbianus TaxID=2926292 RepID=UPI001CD2AC60|nr:hypothetical protein [Lacticaseibacillus kribbianus]
MKSKWVKLAVALMVATIALAGCFGGKKAAETKPSAYQTALKAGVKAVRTDEFEQAATHFKDAVAAKATKAAKTDLAQTKAYLTAQKQQRAGRPVRALKTVQKAQKRKHGAAVLASKLKAFAKRLTREAKKYKRAAALLKEAQAQADAGETAQAKATLAPLAPLDWTQTYLKRLKAHYDELTQTLAAAAASATSATAESETSSSSSADTASSADKASTSSTAPDPTAADQPKVSWNQAAGTKDDGDKATDASASSSSDDAKATTESGNDLSAASVRSVILTYFGTQLSADAVNAVPDDGILQAYKDTLAVGGDVGYTVSLLEERYPDVVLTTAKSTTTADDTAASGD